MLPDRYPLAHDVERYVADEQRLGRMLDYAVIVPRLQCLYAWSRHEGSLTIADRNPDRASILC